MEARRHIRRPRHQGNPSASTVALVVAGLAEQVGGGGRAGRLADGGGDLGERGLAIVSVARVSMTLRSAPVASLMRRVSAPDAAGGQGRRRRWPMVQVAVVPAGAARARRRRKAGFPDEAVAAFVCRPRRWWPPFCWAASVRCQRPVGGVQPPGTRKEVAARAMAAKARQLRGPGSGTPLRGS